MENFSISSRSPWGGKNQTQLSKWTTVIATTPQLLPNTQSRKLMVNLAPAISWPIWKQISDKRPGIRQSSLEKQNQDNIYV